MIILTLFIGGTMGHKSEFFARHTQSRDELSQTAFYSRNPALLETLEFEEFHSDYLLARFFNATALANYFRAVANVDHFASLEYYPLDKTVLSTFHRILSGELNFPETFDFSSDERIAATELALGVEDDHGNLELLSQAFPRLVSYSLTPKYTVFYRGDGN